MCVATENLSWINPSRYWGEVGVGERGAMDGGATDDQTQLIHCTRGPLRMADMTRYVIIPDGKASA
jgi:hypothetical protein